MKFKITTTSGSVYVLDKGNKTIHRLSGGGHYTGRCSREPSKYYHLEFPPEVGARLVAVWSEDKDDALVTSYVKTIEPMEVQ
jgi:hypothetical protein